ncbi:MAG: hypothetical protein R6U97_00145 [Desulfosalsimonas sp.]
MPETTICGTMVVAKRVFVPGSGKCRAHRNEHRFISMANKRVL